MPRRGENGVHGVTVEPSGDDFGPHSALRLKARECRPVRSWFELGVVGVAGGEESRHRRESRTCHPPGIARSVEALVVEGSERPEGGELLRSSERPLRQVGVESYSLPFGGRQRRWLVPDAGGDTEGANVMDKAGASKLDHIALGETTASGRVGDQGGDRPRVTKCVR
jgi:hypothetical protein